MIAEIGNNMSRFGPEATFWLCKKKGPAGMVDAGPRTGERPERSNLWLTQG